MGQKKSKKSQQANILFSYKNYWILYDTCRNQRLPYMGTGSSSASFYIAKGIETIQNLEGIRYEVTPMGTILESEKIDKIYEASKKIMEALHNLGVNRVEVVLKIDSRIDKSANLEDKMESIQRYLKTTKG